LFTKQDEDDAIANRQNAAVSASFFLTYLTSMLLLTVKLTITRKRVIEGFVETPGRRTTRRQTSAETDSTAERTITESDNEVESTSVAKPQNGELETPGKRGRGRPRKSPLASSPETIKSNGKANGKANGKPVADPKIDTSGEYEFGGPLGVSALMVGFPLLMWYMWIGATYYDGKLPRPAKGQSTTEFLISLYYFVYEGAYPSTKAWAIYWTYFIVESIFYLYMPGVQGKGKPLPHLGGKQLPYYCSAAWSWFTTIAIALTLHFTGVFKLYTIIDEFGPLMSVAIISGFLLSIVFYVSAFVRGAQHRMTGNHFYDFFMGAELNPRLFSILDFKMFFEVRIPWFMLFLITLGTAARQYEQYGYVSAEVGFLVMAHFLYANACAKGEHLIITTW
jgi:delta24(24(1))-sterol reductase